MRLNVGQDAVQEFQINRSNYGVELGGASICDLAEPQQKAGHSAALLHLAPQSPQERPEDRART